ncbi:MAG: hypothetical protein NZ578_06855 [Candidatus Binatia bacterium]|nr:hypothetical protein [Candidatus Binatia bacterium]
MKLALFNDYIPGLVEGERIIRHHPSRARSDEDGETGTIEIERIGRMTVKVEDPLQRRWPFGIDRGIGQAIRQWKLTGVRPNPDEMFHTKRIA